MKTWKDLKSIAVPDCMSHLPRDARGYPIPFTVAVGSDGKPDFRVIDLVKWGECVVYQKCGITGLPLKQSEFIAFVGGPLSITHRAFTDAGMLPEAARYALQVCPFLAAPKFAYAKAVPQVKGSSTRHIEGTSVVRPEIFGMGLAREYTLARNGPEIIIVSGVFDRVEYWKDGAPHNPLERFQK